MKSILTIAAVTMLLAACKPDPKDQLEGIYVNHSQGSYSIADDTLSVVHMADEQFWIERSTGFNLVRNGKVGSREYETEKWKIRYDHQLKILSDDARAKIIMIDFGEKKLLIGKREYKKIKP